MLPPPDSRPPGSAQYHVMQVFHRCQLVRILTWCPTSVWCHAHKVPNASALLLMNLDVFYSGRDGGHWGDGSLPDWRLWQTKHCGGRSGRRMLADYWELIRN